MKGLLHRSHFIIIMFLLTTTCVKAGKFTFKGLMVLPNAKTPSGEVIGKVEVRYKLDAYFQEPIKVFEMKYFPKDKGTEILGNVTFRARVYSGNLATEAYMTFTPATPAPGKDGHDFPGSPDWHELFHTIDGKGISKVRAKELYKKGGLKLDDLTILKASLRNLKKKKAGKGNFDYGKHVNRGYSRERNEAPLSIETALGSIGEGWTKPFRYSGKLSKAVSCSFWKHSFLDEKKRWRYYKAVCLTLEELPAAQGDGKPLDYADVSFFVQSKSNTKHFKLKMKAGDVWVGLFEENGNSQRLSISSLTAIRSMEEDEEETEKDPFDMLAEKKRQEEEELRKAEERKLAKMEEDIKKGKNQFLGSKKTSTGKVYVDFWDHGDIDGDRIDLIFNNAVERNIRLNDTRKRREFQLKKGINTLSFRAINQGSLGKNSAKFRVQDENGKVLFHEEYLIEKGFEATLLILKIQ